MSSNSLLEGDHGAVVLDDSEANIYQAIYQKLVLVLSDQERMSFEDDYVGLSENLKFVADQIVLLTLNITHKTKPAKAMLAQEPAKLNSWHCNRLFCAV
jgi:hypothetical protein